MPIMLRSTHEKLITSALEGLKECRAKCDKLRQELETQKRSEYSSVKKLEAAANKAEHMAETIREQAASIKKLKDELKQAKKNDTPRDPKTGRFMKVVK